MKGITTALADRKWYNIPSPQQLGNLMRDARFKVVGKVRTSFNCNSKIGDCNVYDVLEIDGLTVIDVKRHYGN